MRLADFISSNLEPILLEWERFARGTKSGEKLDALALRDHAGEILLATIRDMESAQSAGEQSAKSKGKADDSLSVALNGASEQHAIGRLGAGFGLLEVVSEYRALRASVLRQWHEERYPAHSSDIDDVTRFNESIDQSLAKAISSYTERVDQSREMFLAILSHDLRNPLSSIAMSASLLPMLVPPATETLEVVSQISTNAGVMARMISDLLDYTRTRLGAGMPVTPKAMDLGALCLELYNEFRTAHPERLLSYTTNGNLLGNWDVDRLRQAISNILGNAIQHSPPDARIQLSVNAEPERVIVRIHNSGPAIDAGELATIFEPLVRGSTTGHPKANRPGSIGLGLYIAREIAQAHGGTLGVTSSNERGTAFMLNLLRLFSSGDLHSVMNEKQILEM
jgi:signal transduction histidine kinase